MLGNPCARRMPGDIAVQDAPSVMRNHEEAVEHPKRERRHGEEVHRRNSFSVINQKCRPPLRRLRASWGLPHPTQHRSLGDIEAEHLQLTMNPWRTPGWVLGHHAEDKFAYFPAHTFSARTLPMPRQPGPIELEPRPVPANHGVGLYEDQRMLPSRPETTQDHPKQFVRSGKSRMRMSLPQDRKLLPQSQVFKKQIAL